MNIAPRIIACMVLTSVLLGPSILSEAAVDIGKPAPDFTLPGSDGKTYHLADYRGKFVVLEWFNRDCPFTRKHYDGGNMQNLQAKYTQKGVTWFSICSSAPGKQGYLTLEQAQRDRIAKRVKSTATLLDPDGKVGQLYGAKTTPHMFIINPQGLVIYQGAIDDKPTADQEDIGGSRNYVAQALDEAMAGKPVSMPYSDPYGCSVKYK